MQEYDIKIDTIIKEVNENRNKIIEDFLRVYLSINTSKELLYKDYIINNIELVQKTTSNEVVFYFRNKSQ